MRFCLALCFLFVVIGGCSSSTALLSVTPQESPGQEMVYLEDRATIASRGALSSVWASTAESVPVKAEHLEVELSFLNRSLDPREIRLEDFSAYDQNQRTLEIVTADEYAKAIAAKYKSQRNDLNRQGFGAAYQNSGTMDGGFYSGASNYGHAGGLNQADVQRNIPSLDASIENDLNAYLSNQSLYSDQGYAGKIWIAMPADHVKDSEILLNVPLANEVHTFKFSVTTHSSDSQN